MNTGKPIILDDNDKDVARYLSSEDMRTYIATRSDLVWGCLERPVDRGSVHAAFEGVEISIDLEFGNR